jgi:uncharacterized protein YfaS (alpha-2-macroglobulin family)
MNTSSSPDAPASPESQPQGAASGRWRALVGDWQWAPPAWLLSTRDWLLRQPPWRYFAVLALLVAIAVGWAWATRPKVIPPGALVVSVSPPGATDYTKTPIVVDSLTLKFTGSAAPIKAVGAAPAGVEMQPALDGAWKWVDDRTLSFKPATDWPVGQHYTLRIDEKTSLAPGVKLADYDYEFDSQAFTATLASSEFYQDPVDPNLKKGVFEFDFSHPVDAATLESRIKLALQDGAGTKLPEPQHTVSYDERHLKAFVHSAPLTLPENGGKLGLELSEGVASSLGGPGSKDKLSGSVDLPTLYSVSVDSADTALVDNERFEPEQVFVLGFNNAMKDSEVRAATKMWLLPERNPKREGKHPGPEPYAWSEGDDIDEALLAKSQLVSTTALPTEREYIETHSLRFQAPPKRYVYVRVARGLKSFGGFILGQPWSGVRRVPDYPELLRFVGDGALLSLAGERRVSIVSRNLPRARLEVGRLLPQQLQHLAFHNEGTYSGPQLYGLEEDDLVEREELRLDLPADDPAKAHYEGVDLGKFLAPGRRGIFLLSLRKISEGESQLSAEKSIAQNAGTEMDKRLIVLTDLGMLSKKALDGSRDVFVQSISSGKPVEGAEVRAIARNGETLATANTDADGRAHLPDLSGFQREKQAVMLSVTRGDDLSFLPLSDSGRTLDYSRFDIGGEPNALEAGELKAFLFSDRGLYRPGDTVHLGMIVRPADWKRALAGLPLELVFTDPTGRIATRQRIALSAQGFENFDYTPRDSAPSGTWQATLSLIGKDDERTQIGETSVQVREFAPDTMRVRANFSPLATKGWVKPEALSVIVAAENLFGTPAQARRVEGSLVLRPAFPAFADWPDYRFYDPQRAKEGYDEALSDQTTGKDGKAEFKLDLSKYARATYQLSFLARAFEPGSGRNVAAQASTLVSSNPYLVGIKSADDLGYIKRGDKRALQLLAIGPDGKAMAVSGLHAVVVEKRYVSVLTKQDSGVYKYVSKERHYDGDDHALQLGATPQSFVLPTAKPGNFVLELRDASGTVLNQAEFTVAGAANLSRSLERNAELTLALSKDSYKPGETIELSIKAPYAGSGLITIERERVYAQAWFHADTTSSVQHIKVPADFEGNGYVNVQFLRDPASDEVFMSPLSYGVAPFKVDRAARTQPLTLSAPKVVRPGAPIEVELKTEGKARVVLFAVDEGILQVARYKVGDPLDHFFARKALEVETAQILDLVLPEFSRLMALAAPGGDESGDLSKNLNPFKRKAEKPAVWWSGIVDVDGSRKFTFRLPDYFNGRVRITAVAVTPARIGVAETELTARGDFVLTPTVPTHVAPGDEFELPVGVANTIEGAKAPSAVSVSLELPASLSLVGAAPGPVTVAPGDEATVRFRLKAGSALGAAPVVVRALSGKYNARRRIELSLRPAVAASEELRAGHAEQRIVLEKLRDMYEPMSTRRLAASTSPLVAIDGLSAYLKDYPHYCTEQLVSEGMPALVYSSRPELGHKVEGGNPTAGIVDLIRSRQNGEGGIGLWSATPDADDFITGYAALYLLEARERGVAVPDDLLDSLDGYLEQMAADRSKHDMDALRQRAMAVYLLVRQGRNAGNLLAAVQEQMDRDQPKVWRDDVAGLFLAASYQRLQQAKPARDLALRGLTHANAAKSPDFDYEHYYDPAIEQGWTLYLLEKHFPALARQVQPVAIERLVEPLRTNEYNTLSAALIVLALDAHSDGAGNAKPPTLQAAPVQGQARQIGVTQGVVTAGTFGRGDARLWVTPSDATPVWYVLTQSGYDRNQLPAQESQGLEVTREYLDAAGKPVTTMKLGEEVTVRVRLRALGGKSEGDIAISDLLPGGFEAVLQQAPEAAPAAADDSSDAEDASGDEGDGDAESADDNTPASTMPPLALPGATLLLQHAEVREDRVLFYAFATDQVTEVSYKVRANNVGKFVVPPIQAESMYDRRVVSRGPSGATLTVVAPTP